MLNQTHFYRVLVALLCIVMLASCAVIPSLSDKSTTAIEQAEKLAKQGKSIKAAQIYWQQAMRVSSPQRERLQLLAVETVLAPETLPIAKKYQVRLNERQLRGELLVSKRLADAKISILDGQPDAALTALPLKLADVAPSLAPAVLELRARAQLSLGQTLESVTTRILLDARLTDLNDKQTNHQEIWQSLVDARSEQIGLWSQQSVDPQLKGWLTLAYISKTSPSEIDNLKQQLSTWQQQFPGHPAGETAFSLILKDWQALQLKPDRIAVMLSLRGQYSAITNAILTGILAAYYTDGTSDEKPVIQLYDLGETSQNVQDIYARAVDEGADVIIGPLNKQAAVQLSQLPEFPVPVLSLNYSDKHLSPTSNFYQFGLLPEHEATQAADRSYWDGYKKAIVFTPRGEWGNRLSEAFKERFELLGGRVLAAEHYQPRATDFSTLIKHALLLDQSEQRYQNLKQRLNRDIKFEPSRRPDADVVFLAASPRQARLLHPQFKFHYASDLPVYATSHIYSGRENPLLDRDLNEVFYCDMPWIMSTENPHPELRKTIDKLFPGASRQLPRLIALGIDAYRLIPFLKRLAARPSERYSGLTGNLSMNDSRQIFRELKWARFVSGKPQVMDTVRATSSTQGAIDETNRAILTTP